MHRKIIIAVTGSCVLMASQAFAQGMGIDMTNHQMLSNGLFLPHPNYCNSTTEVFVPYGDNTAKGFCIEKNERGTGTWDFARQDCAADSMRLPEGSEFTWACQNAAGLSNMTDDAEWTTNFTSAFTSGGTNGRWYQTSGNGDCRQSTLQADGSTANDEPNDKSYRCVR
jgi:hypothetical protein